MTPAIATYWQYSEAKGRTPKPLWLVSDHNGVLKHWGENKEAAKRMLRKIAGGFLAKLDPPEAYTEEEV